MLGKTLVGQAGRFPDDVKIILGQPQGPYATWIELKDDKIIFRADAKRDMKVLTIKEFKEFFQKNPETEKQHAYVLYADNELIEILNLHVCEESITLVTKNFVDVSADLLAKFGSFNHSLRAEVFYLELLGDGYTLRDVADADIDNNTDYYSDMRQYFLDNPALNMTKEEIDEVDCFFFARKLQDIKGAYALRCSLSANDNAAFDAAIRKLTEDYKQKEAQTNNAKTDNQEAENIQNSMSISNSLNNTNSLNTSNSMSFSCNSKL